MTDAHLMDADCIHGTTWYDCDTCTSQTDDPTRELLGLYETEKARADRYEQAIGLARHCWDVHGDASTLEALDNANAPDINTCDRCEAES